MFVGGRDFGVNGRREAEEGGGDRIQGLKVRRSRFGVEGILYGAGGKMFKG